MGKRSSSRAKALAAGSPGVGPGPHPNAGPACPCGLGPPYERCCGRFHAGTADAGTAELLMRSRYSAFVRQDADYLLRTWHSSTRPSRIGFDGDQQWAGLDVLTSSGGGMLEPTGTVEFRARYRRLAVPGAQHAVSRFVREGGRWVYLDDVTS